jgi:hypothetical protein
VNQTSEHSPLTELHNVLQPVDDEYATRTIDRSDVTGVHKPIRVEGSTSVFLIFVVTGEDVGSTNQKPGLGRP